MTETPPYHPRWKLTVSKMDELIERLEAAVMKLFRTEVSYRNQHADDNAARVKSKREGVQLALSYAREEVLRQQLVEREAEEEVFEPSDADS